MRSNIVTGLTIPAAGTVHDNNILYYLPIFICCSKSELGFSLVAVVFVVCDCTHTFTISVIYIIIVIATYCTIFYRLRHNIIIIAVRT